MKKLSIVTLLVGTFSAVSYAGPNNSSDPCAPIKQACSGFVKGDWKKGDGLMRDCINPIMQGVTTVPGATKPLPTVDPSVVNACKAKHPKFGSGKVGS